MEYLIDHGAKVDAQDDGMRYTSGSENLYINQGILNLKNRFLWKFC